MRYRTGTGDSTKGFTSTRTSSYYIGSSFALTIARGVIESNAQTNVATWDWSTYLAAALAASADPKLLDRNSKVCRDLQPYLEAAKRVASNDPEAFSLFLWARRNAFECYTRLEGWLVP